MGWLRGRDIDQIDWGGHEWGVGGGGEGWGSFVTGFLLTNDVCGSFAR